MVLEEVLWNETKINKKQITRIKWYVYAKTRYEKTLPRDGIIKDIIFLDTLLYV